MSERKHWGSYPSQTPEYRRAYYQKNRHKILEQKRELRMSDPNFKEKKRKKTKQYLSTPSGEEYRRKNYQKFAHTPRKLYGGYRRSCERRGIEFKISLQEFSNFIQMPCHYCGISATTDKPNGIDRVNNELGYFMENLVPCCKKCNMMKSTLSKEDFLTHIRNIFEHITQ